MYMFVLAIFLVSVSCEETSTELVINDQGLDLDGLQDFILDNPDPTDKENETLSDEGEVKKIVTANDHYLEIGTDSDIVVDAPDTFCFRTICVNSCGGENNLCWAPKRCHKNEECEGVTCGGECAENLLSSIKTIYALVIDLPKHIMLINDQISEFKNATSDSV
ncbi:hypothetical protein C0J52_19121 [Blattella germanica]|nr:hypothetical protein C0J52_19121 [Blattella germanica]